MRFLGVGPGIYRDCENAAERAVRISEVYEPSPDTFAAYDHAYSRYVRAYESLAAGGFFDFNKEDDE
ncbi:hypothetical protein ACPCG0_01105 [Propionibacteriaceae bacterium Y1923]|uniref:hypothetical protein n=1 Tax=Aestuariimicrobium sp. Y1814 TaxID=3418742 RepID=UPI003C21FEE1